MSRIGPYGTRHLGPFGGSLSKCQNSVRYLSIKLQSIGLSVGTTTPKGTIRLQLAENPPQDHIQDIFTSM